MAEKEGRDRKRRERERERRLSVKRDGAKRPLFESLFKRGSFISYQPNADIRRRFAAIKLVERTRGGRGAVPSLFFPKRLRNSPNYPFAPRNPRESKRGETVRKQRGLGRGVKQNFNTRSGIEDARVKTAYVVVNERTPRRRDQAAPLGADSSRFRSPSRKSSPLRHTPPRLVAKYG